MNNKYYIMMISLTYRWYWWSCGL